MPMVQAMIFLNLKLKKGASEMSEKLYIKNTKHVSKLIGEEYSESGLTVGQVDKIITDKDKLKKQVTELNEAIKAHKRKLSAPEHKSIIGTFDYTLWSYIIEEIEK